MKKEKLNYFDQFINNTDYILKSTNILIDVTKDYSIDKLIEANEEVHKLEHEADEASHKIIRYLITDFIPPLDREDISLLVNQLDDIEDYIDEVLINFRILNITEIKNEKFKEYDELLEQASKNLIKLFNNLKNFKNRDLIFEEIINISKIEEQADRCFEKNMENLYKEEKNPIEVIKWTTIYNSFENIFDAYEKVIDSIEDIMVKNS